MALRLLCVWFWVSYLRPRSIHSFIDKMEVLIVCTSRVRVRGDGAKVFSLEPGTEWWSKCWPLAASSGQESKRLGSLAQTTPIFIHPLYMSHTPILYNPLKSSITAVKKFASFFLFFLRFRYPPPWVNIHLKKSV